MLHRIDALASQPHALAAGLLGAVVEETDLEAEVALVGLEVDGVAGRARNGEEESAVVQVVAVMRAVGRDQRVGRAPAGPQGFATPAQPLDGIRSETVTPPLLQPVTFSKCQNGGSWLVSDADVHHDVHRRRTAAAAGAA